MTYTEMIPCVTIVCVQGDNSTQVKKESVFIFYENQMNEQYKKYEVIINDINQHVKTTDNKMIKIIYHCNWKLKKLIMKNNLI